MHVSNSNTHDVSLIDISTNTVVENIKVGDGWDAERAMLFNPRNNFIIY